MVLMQEQKTNPFMLSCCSTADMPKSFFEERKIAIVSFSYIIDGVSYPDDLGQTTPYAEFYEKIKQGALPTTSQVSVQGYKDLFESALKAGEDVLHITLSSGISGTYGSALIAQEQLQEDYPNRRIYVIDSLCASSGYGLLMTMVADLRDQGKTIDEIQDWVLENRTTIHHWFFSTDLTHYFRGGRISRRSAFFGNMLHICPLMNVDLEGKLVPRFKIRGKAKVIKHAVEIMEEKALNGTDYAGYCYISTSDDFKVAEKLKAMIEERFPKLKVEIKINWIGAVIGAHTGPGTTAFYYQGSEREV